MIYWSPTRRGVYHAYDRDTHGRYSLCRHVRLYPPRGVYEAGELTNGQLDHRCGTCLRALAAMGEEETA